MTNYAEVLSILTIVCREDVENFLYDVYKGNWPRLLATLFFFDRSVVLAIFVGHLVIISTKSF